jgi:hypothetical protein
MKNHTIPIIILAMVIMATGCKSKSTEKSPEERLTELESNLGKVVPPLRSFDDLAAFMNMTNLAYVEDIGLDPSRVGQYESNPFYTAGAMGIYTADALYKLIYHDNEAARLSYAAAQQLASDLGLEKVFVDNLIQRLEEGMEESGSFLEQMDSALQRSETILDSDGRSLFFTSFVAGNFIEKSYITFELLLNDPNVQTTTDAEYRDDLLDLILQRKNPTNELVKLFEKQIPEEDRGIFMTELKKLNEMYQQLPDPEDVSGRASEPRKYRERIRATFEQTKVVRDVIVNFGT